MSNATADNADADQYELFVRRTFNCDRGDVRFPYADANVWIELINKWNYVNDPTRSKNSLGQRTKDYEAYFKTITGYFDKTFDFAIKKHAGKEGNEGMERSIDQLKAGLAKIKSVAELRALLYRATELLDKFNVVLK